MTVALKHKPQDLIDIGLVIATPANIQSISRNHLPSHVPVPSSPSVSVISSDDSQFDHAEIMAPPGTLVLLTIKRNVSLIIAPINYLPSNPFIIGSPTLVSS